jgi:putative ABC transport system substrate-binding protein
MVFRQKLHELGYVEGQNLVIEWRSAKGEYERLPELAAELIRLKVDVIVTPSSENLVRLWQQATRTIPIVMGGLRVDPVEAGFVDSLARPGGNITGLINLDTELHPKRLELLKEAFPGISRVAILWNESQQEQGMKEIEATGQALGVQIQFLDLSGNLDLDELEDVFFEISQERADALLVAHSAARARIIEFAAKRRLPTISARSGDARAGGLMSYGTDRLHLVRRQAIYVDKILKGATPADLPVEQPRKFDFVINLKTAKALGVTIPPEVLLQATKVIK